jgi:DNA-binding MarR family transcriptional regulator
VPSGPLAFDPIDEARRQWAEHGWDPAVAGMGVVTSIVRGAQLFGARIAEVLKPHGLTFARYEVLALLSFTRRGALPLGKLGERLQVHPASVTNAVDRLEADGLVRRDPNPRDGRGVLAAITAEGRRAVRTVTPLLNQEVFEATGLADDELRLLFELLRKVRAAAGDFTPDDD